MMTNTTDKSGGASTTIVGTEENDQLLAMKKWQQQQEKEQAYGLARMRAVKTRPSTVAAEEFFAPNNRDWKNLPSRLQKLVQSLHDWVRTCLFTFKKGCRDCAPRHIID